MRYMNNKTVICLVFSLVLVSGMLAVKIGASRKPIEYEKVVASVYIEKGDSLWTIAQRYYTEENESMKEYIREIKNCNHLSSNTIREGQYLIVPYYTIQS